MATWIVMISSCVSVYPTSVPAGPNGRYTHKATGEWAMFRNGDAEIFVKSRRSNGMYRAQRRYDVTSDGCLIFSPITSNDSIEFSDFYWDGVSVYRGDVKFVMIE